MLINVAFCWSFLYEFYRSSLREIAIHSARAIVHTEMFMLAANVLFHKAIN
jgi:hypothetical protein